MLSVRSPACAHRRRLRQHRLLLLAGYAIIDQAAFPIVGDPKKAYDTYLEQLVLDAKAAVDKAVELGVVDPDIAPEVALIELVPTPAPVASPAFVIVAVAGVADAQVTDAVKFCVLLSLYVPVAVNC